jgi:hypothetical protein
VKFLLTALVSGFLIVACSAQQIPVDRQPDIVIRDVSVVDVLTGQLLPHTDVAVREGRIISLDTHLPEERPRDGVRIVNGSGKFLIPGLWDMHAHTLWAREAVTTFLPLFVSQGVTGVRDMGGSLEFLHDARDSIARGAWYPTLVAPGPILDGPEPVQASISVAVGDSSRAVQVVDSLAAGGADFIKVYTLIPRQAYLAVLAAAARRHLIVAGHVPAEISPIEAARLGQRSMEHLRDELEPYCTRQTADTCTPMLAVFKEHQVWQVPTLYILRMKSSLDDSSLAHDPRLEYIVPVIREEWLSTRASRARRSAAYFQGKRERVPGEIWLTGLIFRDQGHILAGTDAGDSFSYPGFSLHDELGLLVTAGLSPLDALRAATIEPARFLGAEDTLGSISPGARADLVLLRENPLADISATRTIEAVILRGRLLDRTSLDSLMAVVRNLAGE